MATAAISYIENYAYFNMYKQILTNFSFDVSWFMQV